MTNYHDSIFQFCFSILSVAKAFFTIFLPPEIVKLVIWDTLKEDTQHYIKRGQRRIYSDKVFSAQFHNGSLLWLSILIEHKSYQDDEVMQQLGEYLTGIWRKQRRLGLPLTPVFAVLLTHSPAEFQFKTVRELFPDMPEELYKYQPQFEAWVVDLQKFTDEFLLQLPADYLKNLLYTFKHSHDETFLQEHADEVFLDFEEYLKTTEGKEFVQELFVYFMEMLHLSGSKIEEAMEQIIPQTLKPETMGTITRLSIEWKKAGREIGKKEGREEGREEGWEKGLLFAAISLIINFPAKTDVEIAQLLRTDEQLVAKARKELLDKGAPPLAPAPKKRAAPKRKPSPAKRATKKKPTP